MKISPSGQPESTYQPKSRVKAGDVMPEIKDTLIPSENTPGEGDFLHNIGNKIKNLFLKEASPEEVKDETPLPAIPPGLPLTENNVEMAQQLNAYLAKIMSDPQAEAEMIQMVASLNATGQLRPVLHAVAKTASESGSLPPMPQEKLTGMVDQLAGMIDAELRSHGMTPETSDKIYKNWQTMAEEHLALVRNSKIPPRGPGEPSAFTEPEFIKELETLQGASFRSGNTITPLIDGPASRAERNRLIDNAKHSIHMMTWAFYDDEAGWETVKKLVARHEEGLEVEVVVDAQLADRPGHSETVKYLEEHGVKVVRWSNPDEPYQGQHRKLLVVDGESAVAGGMNPGNVYLHTGPEDGQKWRDTDVLLQGPAVADCEKIFAAACGRDADPGIPEEVGNASVAAVNHSPGVDAHIMLATMKAIQGASGTIDIENAYFIQTPGIKEALLDALKRGVRVRILTNSAESVDEQIVSAPILRSLPELVQAGAGVYLKQGDTLHSKFMVVDGMYSSVGSYNLHPRSERYEGEMTLNTLDTDTAGNLTNTFEKDIAQAKRVNSADEITVPENILTIIPERYFFDQL